MRCNSSMGLAFDGHMRCTCTEVAKPLASRAWKAKSCGETEAQERGRAQKGVRSCMCRLKQGSALLNAGDPRAGELSCTAGTTSWSQAPSRAPMSPLASQRGTAWHPPIEQPSVASSRGATMRVAGAALCVCALLLLAGAQPASGACLPRRSPPIHLNPLLPLPPLPPAACRRRPG